ncbi:MAG: hypothetical protein QOK21_922 [Solirubrobacteraceae bacterium]|jgi:hypothetical protein|nr:hypothetical protein [Solirubrobacteraceae bacterium]
MASHGTAVPADMTSDLEARALDWIAPFSQAEHLIQARAWVLRLDPAASLAIRLAALTHDVERMFAGGPQQNFAEDRWDDPDYLFAHSTRSADFVQRWLEDGAEPPDASFIRDVRRLVLLHELGGDAEADVLQAADSLSYLETLQELTAGWVAANLCSAEKARDKLVYMRDRIRIPSARRLAEPLFEAAAARLGGASPGT